MITRSGNINVTIVLPVYARGIAFLSTINSNCLALLKAEPNINWTIIIINDGSPEIPSENNLLQNLSANINYQYYHYETNKGKGYAVRFGLHIAPVSDFYIYTDYDFPFGIISVVDTVNILRQMKTDVVVADRGGNYLSRLPFSRKILSKLIRVINANIFKLRISDTQAGLKGMNSISLSAILKTTVNGFLFDLQFIKKAEEQQMRIGLLAVECDGNIQLTSFKVRVIYKEIKNLFIILYRNNAPKNTFSSDGGSGRVRYCKRIWSNTSLEKANRNYPAGFGKTAKSTNGVGY